MTNLTGFWEDEVCLGSGKLNLICDGVQGIEKGIVYPCNEITNLDIPYP